MSYNFSLMLLVATNRPPIAPLLTNRPPYRPFEKNRPPATQNRPKGAILPTLGMAGLKNKN